MKTEPIKIEFTFHRGNNFYKVVWKYSGKKMLNCINYKLWDVSIVLNYDTVSNMANVIIGDSYETTLQPNLSNAMEYLHRNVK